MPVLVQQAIRDRQKVSVYLSDLGSWAETFRLIASYVAWLFVKNLPCKLLLEAEIKLSFACS